MSRQSFLLAFACFAGNAGRAVGFVPPMNAVGVRTAGAPTFVVPSTTTKTSLGAVDVAGFVEIGDSVASAASSSAVLLSETEAWVKPLSLVMGPTLNFLSFAMLCRVVASWYPDTNLNKPPWLFIAWPTEPLLRVVKGSIPPAFGVDITPVFWLAIFTFINEILLGQQGLLTMKMKYGI